MKHENLTFNLHHLWKSQGRASLICNPGMRKVKTGMFISVALLVKFKWWVQYSVRYLSKKIMYIVIVWKYLKSMLRFHMYAHRTCIYTHTNMITGMEGWRSFWISRLTSQLMYSCLLKPRWPGSSYHSDSYIWAIKRHPLNRIFRMDNSEVTTPLVVSSWNNKDQFCTFSENTFMIPSMRRNKDSFTTIIKVL